MALASISVSVLVARRHAVHHGLRQSHHCAHPHLLVELSHPHGAVARHARAGGPLDPASGRGRR